MAVTFTERGTYNAEGSGATRTITLASGLAKGSIIAVACRATLTGGITLTSVASTKATFGSPVELAAGALEVAVTIGVVTEAMTASDTVTLTFANDGGYYTSHGAVYEITDVTTTANTTATAGTTYTNTPSCSGTATANVAVFGLMSTTVTYTVGSGWTSSDAHTSGAYNNFYYSRTASAVAIDPGGSLSASTSNWWCVWVALELAATAAFARPSSDVAGGTFRSIVTTAPFGPRVIA